MNSSAHPGWRPLVIAYAGFVILGLPGAALGVLWPSLRDAFGLDQSAQGILVTAVTVGSLLMSFNNGRLIGRFDVGRFVLGGMLLSTAGLLGYVLSPALGVVLVGGFALGLGNGAINAGLNTFVARHYSAGRLNWLHASFGLGSTLSPLLATFILNQTGGMWRFAYLLMVLANGALATVFMLTLALWTQRAPQQDGIPAPRARQVPARATLRLPAVWIGMALFMAFTGAQGGASNWAYSLFTEGRGIDPALAGTWASVYWACILSGRVLLGFIVDRLGTTLTLRLSTVGATLGALLLWWNPAQEVSFLGLALMGLSLASLYPTLIAVTPARVGQEHAPNAIGFQIAASGIGHALLASGIPGVLAGRIGLEAVAPFLLLCAVVAFGLNELGLRSAARTVRLARATS